MAEFDLNQFLKKKLTGNKKNYHSPTIFVAKP